MVRKRRDHEDNLVDYIDPPRLPQVIQPFYEPTDVEAVLKAIGTKNRTPSGAVLTLFDTGVKGFRAMRYEGW